MVIEKLTVWNFKNYEHEEFLFSKAINLIKGLNGSGKTNLLDAIHYLSLTRSAFTTIDNLNIKTGKPFFSIQSQIISNEKTHVVFCNYVKGQKKEIKIDKVLYPKASDHIGKFPCILITPYDTDIIREGSLERRKFFDTLISQINHTYLQNLIEYNHYLKQRNIYLKEFAQNNKVDNNLLDFYNLKLIALAKIIHVVRKDFIEEFKGIFSKFYAFISSENDDVSLKYESHCQESDFEEKFLSSLERDIILQRTSIGTHKDDFVFKINQVPLKNFGSQGQQKSYVISLKIAQHQIIKLKKGFSPVLLLDDIFDKLDDQRINKFLELISSDIFGQIFITDASIDRLKIYLGNITSEIATFRIEKGTIVYE